MTKTHSVDLNATSHAASDARRWLGDVVSTFGEGVDRSALEDLRLLASELVTNAARASTSVIEVTVSERRNRIRLEVADAEWARAPVPRTPAPDQAGGRGLMIVDAIAADWGWLETGDGRKVVWAELARDPAG